jgi:hypothetical protein
METDEFQNLGGLEMPSAPRWSWNTELSYYPKWLKGFRSSIEWQYISEWYQNQINTIKYEGYNLLNLRVGYQWKGIELYTNVMNLSDELYANSASRGNNPTDRTNYNPGASTVRKQYVSPFTVSRNGSSMMQFGSQSRCVDVVLILIPFRSLFQPFSHPPLMLF